MNLEQLNEFELDFHSSNDIMELYQKYDFINRHETEKLGRQAEISFKAGQESGCYAEGWASGIKEAVDWVVINLNTDSRRDEWQTQLKEWGYD